MDVKRRQFMGVSAAGVAGALAMAPDSARAAQPTSVFGRDATQYGVRPGSPDDQTKALQRAIDEAARAQAPLSLPPGVYCSACKAARNWSACAARPNLSSTAAPRCCRAKVPTISA